MCQMVLLCLSGCRGVQSWLCCLALLCLCGCRGVQSWACQMALLRLQVCRAPLHPLQLPAELEPRVRENAEDGELLCSLKRAELIQELGLTPLQAAKVLQRLRR